MIPAWGPGRWRSPVDPPGGRWPGRGNHSRKSAKELCPLGGGWRLRSLGRLSRGCCRSAPQRLRLLQRLLLQAIGTPVPRGWQERREWRVDEAGAPWGELVSEPGLLEAEVTLSLPLLPGLARRRHLRPLLAGTCLWRSLPAKLPIPLPPALPFHLVINPLLLPDPSSLPRASYFPCSELFFIYILVSPSEVDWSLLFPFLVFREKNKK